MHATICAFAVCPLAMAATNDDNLLFAIPKKGRLHEKILKLLKGAGLDYYRVRVDLSVAQMATESGMSGH